MDFKGQNYLLLFIAVISFSSCSTGDKPTSKNTPAQESVQVTLAKPRLSDHSEIELSGSLEPAQNALLSTRIMGNVLNIPIDIDEEVAKGELLLRISAADVQAQLQQTKAQIKSAEIRYENARRDLQRYKELRQNQSVTPKELEQVKQSYEAALSGLKSARQQKAQVEAQLEYTEIKAPFPGKVTQIMAEKGDMAKPGQPLLAVEGLGDWEIVARVSEKNVAQLQAGDSVTVNIPSLDKDFAATLSSVSGSSRHSGGQFIVKAQLTSKSSPELFSGMYAQLRIPQENAPSTYTISREALIEKGGLKGVYTVSEQGTAILNWLKTGKIDGGQVEVLAGLSKEDRYIKTFQGKIYNGVTIAQ